LFREFAAARQRQRDQVERDIALAWQVVRIYVQTQNDKHVPALDSLLPRDPSLGPRRQTHAEQRAALATLSEMYGGPIHLIKRRAS
jgi:hypothetical protein